MNRYVAYFQVKASDGVAKCRKEFWSSYQMSVGCELNVECLGECSVVDDVSFDIDQTIGGQVQVTLACSDIHSKKCVDEVAVLVRACGYWCNPVKKKRGWM